MPSKRYAHFYLIAAVSLTLMATDIYLPAMPMMSEYFEVSNTIIQYTIALYVLGLVASALFYGPLSDSLGRRKMLLIGYGIFLVSSIVLTFTNNVGILLALRFLQGCGSGVASAIGPAVINDLYEEKESGKIIAQMSMVIVLAPAIAPTLGGYLAAYIDWRACFAFISIAVGVVYTIFYFHFPESHPKEIRSPLNLARLLGNYKQALSQKAFAAYLILHSLPSCGIWCLFTVLPFVFIKQMDVQTEHFGYYVAFMILGHSLTSFFVQRIIIRTGQKMLIRVGIAAMFISSLTLIFSALLAPQSPLIATLAIIPYMIAMPFLFPTSMSRALSYVRDIRGTGASCIALTRQAFSFLGTSVAAMISDVNLIPAAIFILVVSSCMLFTLKIAHRYEESL